MTDFAFRGPEHDKLKRRMEKRLANADTDEELGRVVKQAAKHGVDWSHMLEKNNG